MQTSTSTHPQLAFAQRLRSAFTRTLAHLFAATAVAAASLPMLQPPQVAQAAGSITGNVFQDFNSNGAKDTSGATGTAVDTGVAGVSINAYDASGALRGTALSDPSGAYTLTATGSGPYRIEFSNWPAGFQPGFHGTSGTSVQFVEDGIRSNVNFALNKPAEYCQNNPTLCTNSYVFGDQVNGAGKTASVLFSFPYTGTGSTYDVTRTPAPGALATAQQLGSTFGLAYARSSKMLFASSYYKAYAGVGPGGPGAIYRIPTGGGLPSVLLSIPNAGTDTHTSGTVNTGPGNNNPGTWLSDFQNWDQVGKSSLGGMQMSDDGQTLFVVNLSDRHLYLVDTSAAAPITVDLGLIPAPCSNPDDARPMGLGWRDGVLYVGGVCSAQSSGSAANLSAYIYTYSAGSFSAAPVFAFGLDSASYPHGRAGNGCGPNNGSGNWNAWTATNQFTNGSTGAFCAYPQPILSDIVFDGNAMILGIRDRFGDQAGQDIPGAANGGEGVSAGDVVRACGTTGTSWVLESNSVCGGITGAGAGDGQGPGGGEFYQDTFGSATTLNANHNEISLGGLAHVPGFSSVAFTAMDPSTANDNDWRAGGVRFASNTNGMGANFYGIYDKCDSSGLARQAGNCAAETGRFGKVAGMGDIVALCDEAPIEIGNRVWMDGDADGVQDPGEIGIPGVTVHLYDLSGNAVATTTTDAAGNYYFDSLTSELRPNTSYTLRLDNPANYAPGGPLERYTLTTANATGDSQDQRDSDAVLQSNIPVIAVTTGAAGVNNHTLDAGFYLPASLGNYVWVDANHDGQQNDGATGIGGVLVTLYDANGSPISTTQTSGTGFYEFTNLAPGTYSVGFTAPANYTFTLPGSNASSDTDSNVGANGLTAPVTLAPGENNPTLDAGVWLPDPKISLKKYVNSDDAEVAPGIIVPVGSSVVFSYVVSNTGNITLTNVTLTDDKIGPIGCPKTMLAIGESMSCVANGTAIMGQYTNVGSVTGTNSFNPSQQVTSTNPANYFGGNAGLVLKKYTHGRDADTIPSDQPTVLAGSTVTWTYVVTNTGNVALTNVSVSDDIEGAIVCPKSTLQPGESMTCTKTGIARAGQYGNVGQVVGTDPNNPSQPLISSDPSHYVGGQPQLVIRKRSVPVDSAQAPAIVDIGDVITYTLQVTNTGSFTATAVKIADAIPAGTQFAAGSAAPAQSSGPDPLIWNVGTLAPGQTTSVRFSVKVVNRNPAAVQNFGLVSSSEVLTVTSNTVVHVFSPTAVELIAFTVNGNRVQWTTGAELNTFGFALYRSRTGNRSDAVLATREMLTAKGGNSRYTFIDETAEPGAVYHYWLVETETSGATAEYGPVKTNLGTNANGVATNNPAPIASAAIAGGVPVQVDGSSADAANNTADGTLHAVVAPAPAAQRVSVVNAATVEAMSAPAEADGAAQTMDAPASANQPAPTAVAPAQAQTDAVQALPTSVAAVAKPSATEGTTVQAKGASAQQKAVVAVAVSQSPTQRTAAPKGIAHTVLHMAALQVLVVGSMVCMGLGVGVGLFAFMRRRPVF